MRRQWSDPGLVRWLVALRTVGRAGILSAHCFSQKAGLYDACAPDSTVPWLSNACQSGAAVTAQMFYIADHFEIDLS